MMPIATVPAADYAATNGSASTTWDMGNTGTPPAPVLDVEGTLARFGGDRELFAEMAGFALEDAPPLFEQLRRAVEAEDAAAIGARAHALKGLLAGCGGARAAQVAQRLEDAGEAAVLRNIATLVETLEHELHSLTQALKPYCV